MPRRDVWRIEWFARHEVDHVPHSHKLFGHFERLIWPLCRSHSLHFELMFASRAI